MCIYYLLLWHFYCEEAQVAPDSPEQKKDFSLEAAKLADVVKHLQGYKLVLSNWCTLMTWCVDMMIITEDNVNISIQADFSKYVLEGFLPRRSPAPSLWMSWSDLKNPETEWMFQNLKSMPTLSSCFLFHYYHLFALTGGLFVETHFYRVVF